MRTKIKLLSVALFCFSQMVQAESQYMNMTSTGVKPPSPPNYSSCSMNSPTYGSCVSAIQAAYQQNLNTYNQIKQQELASQQKEAENKAKYESQKAAAEEAQRQNAKAQSKYERSQMLTQVSSMVFSGLFAGSCAGAGATCNYAFLAGSVAMTLFSNKAGQQATTHNQSEYQACNFANQVSTNTSNCGSAPGDFKADNYPFNVALNPDSIITNDGKCTGPADICKDITDNLPPGTSLKDYKKGISAFASSNTKKPFKVNPDGSITAANGKTYTAADFASTEAMIASGVSPSHAKMIADMMKKNDALMDTRKELADFSGMGSDYDAAANAAAVTAAAAAGNGTLGSNLDADSSKDKIARSLASAEGLSKDFNGELIGVSGDDIFKMMNRRYRLKANQDTFLIFRP